MINLNKKTAVLTTALALSLAGGAYAATSALTKPTALTGSVTDKISAAVTAKYPSSTLTGVESEPGSTYEARIQKSDGTQLTILLDKDYNITGTRTGGRGGFGPGGHGGFGHGPDTAALARSLGVTEAKLTAALAKVAPPRKGGADFAAAIAKALNVSQSDVQSVLDAQRPDGNGRGGGPGGPGADQSALVSALASKFNLTTAKVQTALDAARPDRGDRETQLATALAKELGLDASKVQAALQATHP